MDKQTQNLLMWGAILAGGYYVYTNYIANAGASANASGSTGTDPNASTDTSGNVAGYLGRPRRHRQIMRQQGGGSSGASSQQGWGDTQDASQYDAVGVEFENEAGYS